MNKIPEQLRYSSDHEWVRRDGDTVTIGITDYAQESLGDVVFVELPEVGMYVKVNDSFMEVESTKSVSDIYAPVAGSISAVNDRLEDQPELLNSDPYGEGWICSMTMSVPDQFYELLNADSYRSLTEG